HAGAAATNDDGVIRKSANARHESDTPQNLHTPDEQHELKHAACCLEEKTQHRRPTTKRHRGQVVSRDGPHANPGMHDNRQHGQQTEDAHCIVGEQSVPFGIAQVRIDQQKTNQKYKVCRQNNSRNALSHPVIEARTRKICDVGYHTHTPARTINTTDRAMTILEPALPPSSVSPTPASMNRWRVPATK